MQAVQTGCGKSSPVSNPFTAECCIEKMGENRKGATVIDIRDDNAELMERHAVLLSPSRIEELVKIFIHATKVRYIFTHVDEGGGYRIFAWGIHGLVADMAADGDWILGDVPVCLMMGLGVWGI